MSRLPDAAYTTLGRTGRRVSRVGFGCYRVDERVDEHRAALEAALHAGVTLIDTSTNYVDGWSERLVGRVVRTLDAGGSVPREAVTLVTKAGYVQGSNQREARRRRLEGKPWSDMVELEDDLWHCISPDFLEDQLTASLERLELPSVDVFLLHNPEYFLKDAAHREVPLHNARDAFYDRIRRAFETLEAECDRGRIGAYGVSSNTFVVPREEPEAVDLTRILSFSGPRFRVIQLPFNPLETGAREPIHTADGRSVLDVAKEAGLGVLVNRPLNAFSPRGLVRFALVDSLPEERERHRIPALHEALDTQFGRDARGGTVSQRTVRALAETPGVDCVLVGMRRVDYVDDVIGAFGKS